MSNIKKKNIGKYRVVIELFDEKTGEAVRVIHFKHSNEFDRFLEGFNAMGYPGYGLMKMRCWFGLTGSTEGKIE